MLLLGFRPLPDAALRTLVVTGISDHVDQFVALDAVKATDRRLVPAIDGPFERLQRHHRDLQERILDTSGEWDNLAEVILDSVRKVRLTLLEAVDEAHRRFPS